MKRLTRLESAGADHGHCGARPANRTFFPRARRPGGLSAGLPVHLLALLCLAATSFAAGPGGLEIYLDGQLLRHAPDPSTPLLVQTGSVGRIDLRIPDGGSVFGIPPGIFSFANDRGSFAITASTGLFTRTNTATLRWRKEFTRLPDYVPFTYTVNPSILYLIVPNGEPTNHLLASWKLVVSVDGIEFMSSERVIEGFPRRSGPTAFGLTTNTGPIETLSWDGPTALHDAAYHTRRYHGELDLRLLRVGAKFNVEYELSTQLINTLGGESLAEVYIGDPLKYGSGIQMSYGAFGEAFFLQQIQFDPLLGAMVHTPFEAGFYFILCRTIGINGTNVAVAMRLGSAGNGILVDPNPPAPSGQVVFYIVKKLPIDQPFDSDGDGIHDVYELEHASILDPLNHLDGSEDPDRDGFSNLAEFRNGTDPATFDAPATPLVRFPGVFVPSFPGGQLVDLNGDGVPDAADRGTRSIWGALGNAGGTFQSRSDTPIAGARSLSDAIFLRLDGDTLADAVAVDLLTTNIYVLRGLGDGRFVPLTNYLSLGDPRQVVAGDLNGDGRKDLAVRNANGRAVDLWLGAGDGTFTQIEAIRTGALGGPLALALADENGDGRDDVIVTFVGSLLGVYLSKPGGGFASVQTYPIGRAADSLVVGDLNNDGHADLVVANRSSDTVTVLLGAAGGTFPGTNTYPVATLPLGLQLGDLNGDGLLDIVVGQVGVDYMTVLMNRGGGVFSAGAPVPASGTLIDWNGDQKLDVLTPLTGLARGGFVNLGRGDGTFAGRSFFVTSNALTKVTPLDLNGDHRLELIGLNGLANAIDVWEHAAVTGTNRLLARVGAEPTLVTYAAGDFNRDGLIDLVLATGTNQFGRVQGSNQIVMRKNQGNFGFQDSGHYPLAFKPDRLAVGDFNGDGRADVTVVSVGGTLNGGVRLLTLTGDGSGGLQPTAPTLVGTTLLSIDAGDFNGDQRSELVLSGQRLTGSSTASFLEVWSFDFGTGWSARQTLAFSNNVVSAQVHDMNGDALADVVTLESDQFAGVRTLVFYPGGSAGPGARQVLATNVEFLAISRLADLNNDGLVDLVSGNTLFIAKPGGGFNPGQAVWLGDLPPDQVADFNGDGKPDLMTGLSILLQE